MGIKIVFLPIVYGVLAGLGYAVVFLMKALQSGESFELKKFVRSLLIGGFIGGITAYYGVPLNELNYEVQVATYGFVTIIVDQLIKFLWRLRNPVPTPP